MKGPSPREASRVFPQKPFGLSNYSFICKWVFNICHVQNSVAGSMDETKEDMKCVSHSETYKLTDNTSHVPT